MLIFVVVSNPVLALRALPALMPVKQVVGKERRSTNAELRTIAVAKFIRDIPVVVKYHKYPLFCLIILIVLVFKDVGNLDETCKNESIGTILCTSSQVLPI